MSVAVMSEDNRLAQVMVRCWEDLGFRKLLQKDPQAVAQQYRLPLASLSAIPEKPEGLQVASLQNEDDADLVPLFVTILC